VNKILAVGGAAGAEGLYTGEDLDEEWDEAKHEVCD
jgi:hypothetical protein